MSTPLLVVAILSLAQGSVEPALPHASNPILAGSIRDGIVVKGVQVRLPAPSFADGLDAVASLAALKGVVGDDRAVKEFLRDSVTAPFILKTRDVKAGDDIVRVADLWFAVRAGLDDVDPDAVLRQADEKAVEVGNMRFASKVLGEDDLRARKVEPVAGRKEWYTHSKGRLLDRISVEATDHAAVTRSPESLAIASRTDPAFDRDDAYPNRWTKLARAGGAETSGPPQIYGGAISYVKITRLASEPDVLLVESHLAFVEPREWFDGNPILRSKFGVIAQDQVRQLRREIARRRAKK